LGKEVGGSSSNGNEAKLLTFINIRKTKVFDWLSLKNIYFLTEL
jgi:hypothetical protein